VKKLIAVFLFTLFISTAQAEAVFLFPRCSWSPSGGECTLINTTGKDITCNIRATAQTRRGSFLYAYDYRVLYTGMWAWVRVYANDPMNDPITYMQADAYCNTLH
jgi:hypothetical protein